MASKDPVNRRAPVVHSTRVDKVSRRAQVVLFIRATAAVIVTLIILIPVIWMGMTAFKSRPDAVAVPPKVFFTPTLEGFVSLLTKRAVLPQARLEALQERTDLNWYERIALERGQEVIGVSQYVGRLRNSLIIAGGSTLAAVVLGLLAGYAFSRFDVPGKGDLLFYILSQRMLPAVVVTIPIFLMYRQLGLHDTHIGMIILYTVFNVSLSVWLLKGFIDEIPREYEEAAMVDGYSRLQAFFKIVLPQSVTGIAATTVFCLVFAWNEYIFSLMLTQERARTAPVSIPAALGSGGMEWGVVAAGGILFLLPVVVVTFALRKYLLRGVTFGAIRG
jgi:multiple sugar transport system permease protein